MSKGKKVPTRRPPKSNRCAHTCRERGSLSASARQCAWMAVGLWTLGWLLGAIHPLSFALTLAEFVAFSGFAVSLGNWAAMLVMLVPIFVAFLRRMKVEEQALSDALGEEYVSYMRRTKRLVPFIY